MKKNTEDILEKLGKNSIIEEIGTNDEYNKVEFINLNNKEKDLKEKIIDFEKEGENIKEQNFEEDTGEDDMMLKMILEDLDKNIFINIKDQEEKWKQKAIDEILESLKYLHSDKNIRISSSPFKPLLQPKKVSMVGRVFFNNSSNNENSNSTKDSTNWKN